MLLTQDQTDFRDSVRDFVGSVSSTERTLEFVESGAPFDAVTWRRITTELGLTSLGIAERLGGAGASVVESCIALEECGAALAPVPLLAASWSSAALGLARGESADRHQQRISSGATYLFALPVNLAGWQLPTLSVDAEGRVSGRVAHVAAGGDVVVALAGTPDGAVALVVVELDAGRADVGRMVTYDPTRPHVTITLRAHPADVVAIGDDDVRALRNLCIVMTGAESIGAMRHTLQSLIAYSKERFAFGRAIGSYQAVKHQLVDHWVTLECAQAALVHAQTTRDPVEFASTAALIRYAVLNDAARVATDVVRLYGGIGYTWEHEAHLYCKRTVANSVVFGPAYEGRGDLLALLPV